MPINHVERACRAWPILANVAKQKNPTITYGELGAKVGIHHRAIRYVLGVIQDYCLEEKLPPLTILVVSQSDGMPGEGFIAWDVDNFEAGIAKVVEYPWDQLGNPFSYASDGDSEDGLADELFKTPSRAGDVYARVKVRGVAQSIFRKTLIRTYDGSCSICGLTFEEALEAAHLIPWSKANHNQRMSPTNGILLCATHHRLFDRGYMTIDSSHRVVYRDPHEKDGAYSEFDSIVSARFHGKPAIMPRRREHRPNAEALSYHHQLHDWSLT